MKENLIALGNTIGKTTTLYKKLVLPNIQYFTIHLNIVNALLPANRKMVKREIELLANFMSLSGDLVENDRFCTSARKIVKESMNISDGGMGNLLKSLRDKGNIINDNNKYKILSILIPENSESQAYKIEIINASKLEGDS